VSIFYHWLYSILVYISLILFHCFIIKSTGHFVNMSFHYQVISSASYFINWSFLPLVIFVIWSFYQVAIISTGLFINWSFHQLVISSTGHFINWSFHQLVISSNGHFIKWSFYQLVFLPLVISSTRHFICGNFVTGSMIKLLLYKKFHFSFLLFNFDDMTHFINGTNSSTFHFINKSFHQPVILPTVIPSTCHFISLPFHRLSAHWVCLRLSLVSKKHLSHGFSRWNRPKQRRTLFDFKVTGCWSNHLATNCKEKIKILLKLTSFLDVIQ